MFPAGRSCEVLNLRLYHVTNGTKLNLVFQLFISAGTQISKILMKSILSNHFRRIFRLEHLWQISFSKRSTRGVWMHFPIELKSIFHLNLLPEGNMSLMTNIFNGYIWISIEKHFLLENTYIGTIEASKERFSKEILC